MLRGLGNGDRGMVRECPERGYLRYTATPYQHGFIWQAIIAMLTRYCIVTCGVNCRTGKFSLPRSAATSFLTAVANTKPRLVQSLSQTPLMKYATPAWSVTGN